jgi:hypothetical protein
MSELDALLDAAAAAPIDPAVRARSRQRVLASPVHRRNGPAASSPPPSR